MKRRVKVATGVAAALAMGLATSGAYIYWQNIWAVRCPKEFDVVVAGRLYRGAQPARRHLEALVRHYGIRTFLCLRKHERETRDPNLAAEKRFAKDHGLTYIDIPLDCASPERQIEEALAVIDDPAHQPVYVHCSAGRERTGIVCGVYRIERMGWSPDRAIAELLSYGADRVNAEDGTEKDYITYLRAYHRHNRRTSTSAHTGRAGGSG